MKREGRKVVGGLVQDPVTGYWRPAAPQTQAASTTSLPVDPEFVLTAHASGWDRAEIAAQIKERFGGVIATLYRQVDQVLLDAGIRERVETSRKATGRSATGEAALPVRLRGLR